MKDTRGRTNKQIHETLMDISERNRFFIIIMVSQLFSIDIL